MKATADFCLFERFYSSSNYFYFSIKNASNKMNIYLANQGATTSQASGPHV